MVSVVVGRIRIRTVRFVYPQGPIWSVAIGPLTLLFRIKEVQSPKGEV